MNSWIRLAVAATAAVGLTSTGVASAQDSAPITISPDQVKKLCEERAPKVEDRITRLTTRIDGGPDAPGSTAWLKAWAQEARDKGRTTRAERLERRDGQLAELGDAQRRVDEFQAEHRGVK